MATLLAADFTALPNGPLGPPWSLTGSGVMTIVSPLLTLTGSDTNGYATAALGGSPTSISATYLFHGGTPDPTVCLINHNEGNFVGANMRLHCVITPDNLLVQLRQNNGAFETLHSAAFAPALPRDTPVGVILSFNGDVVTITHPDGTVGVFSDPRMQTMGGGYLTLQTIRAAGSDPLSAWLTANVTGVNTMARTSRVTQKFVVGGTTETLTAVDGTNGEVIDAGNVVLEVNNASGSSINVTVGVPITIQGMSVGPLVVAVPAGTSKFIGPFTQSTFSQTAASAVSPADIGRVYVNYSPALSVTAGVFSF